MQRAKERFSNGWTNLTNTFKKAFEKKDSSVPPVSEAVKTVVKSKEESGFLAGLRRNARTIAFVTGLAAIGGGRSFGPYER
jgi:hypothetical protein